YNVDPEYPLIVAANRDEFLDRPALPLNYWPDAPDLLAGKDLRGGGTWLGVSTRGCFAALTNYRDLRRPPVKARSRGLLVLDMLREHRSLRIETGNYDGFNLIHGHWQSLHYQNNIDHTFIPLPDGIHGLSNALLNTPWPKVIRAKHAMERIVFKGDPDAEALFELLADETPVEAIDLPDTGIDVELEKLLGRIKIRSVDYGTRCSTVLIVDRNGNAVIEERSLNNETPTVMRFSCNFPLLA
ncbi:MAG: NRDE family protein, partial [Bacteroidota bacterium]|nr:NRDE family protein [Bacteroidota bacterium]